MGLCGTSPAQTHSQQVTLLILVKRQEKQRCRQKRRNLLTTRTWQTQATLLCRSHMRQWALGHLLGRNSSKKSGKELKSAPGKNVQPASSSRQLELRFKGETQQAYRGQSRRQND